MAKIPWPTTHTGLTPADIPYGYSAFPTIWDDDSGYEPKVVGSEIDDSGRTVILVALSPGRYLSCTLVTAGGALEDQVSALLAAIGVVRGSPTGSPLLPPQQPDSAPVQGPKDREATP